MERALPRQSDRMNDGDRGIVRDAQKERWRYSERYRDGRTERGRGEATETEGTQRGRSSGGGEGRVTEGNRGKRRSDRETEGRRWTGRWREKQRDIGHNSEE